jgi:hydroxymethylpyrimidine pyrophosphatase-like HAD family hydrolase
VRAEIEGGAALDIDGTLADYAEERKAIIAEARRKLAEDGAMPIITDAIEMNTLLEKIIHDRIQQSKEVV